MENVEGIIIKAKKIWLIRINKKLIRISNLYSSYPYLIKVRYNVDNNYYEKNKIVYFGKDISINDKVIITYLKEKPYKIVKIVLSR